MKTLFQNRWINFFLSLTMVTTQVLPYGYSDEPVDQEKNIQGGYTAVMTLADAEKQAAADKAAAEAQAELEKEDPFLKSIGESPLSAADAEPSSPGLLKIRNQSRSKKEVEEMAKRLVDDYRGEHGEYEVGEWNHPFQSASTNVIDENNPTLLIPQQGSLKLTRKAGEAVETYTLTINDQGLLLSSVEVKSGDDLLSSISWGYDTNGNKTSESKSENKYDEAHNQIMSHSAWRNMSAEGQVTSESTSDSYSEYDADKRLIRQKSESHSKYDNNGTPQTNASNSFSEWIYAGEVLISQKSESHSFQNDIENAGSTSSTKVELDADNRPLNSQTQSDSWSVYNDVKSEYHYGTTEAFTYNEKGDLLEKLTRSENKSTGYSSSSETHLVNTYDERGFLVREETKTSSTYNGNQNSTSSTVKNIKRDDAGRSVFEESVSSYNGTVNSKQTVARVYLDDKSDKPASEVTEYFYVQGSDLKLSYRQSLELGYNADGILVKTHHQQDSFYGTDNALSYRTATDTVYNEEGKPLSVVTSNYNLDGGSLVLQSTTDWKYRYSEKDADGKTHVLYAVHSELDGQGHLSSKETKRYDPRFSPENPNTNQLRPMYDIAVSAYSYYMPNLWWGYGGGLEPGLLSRDNSTYTPDEFGEAVLISSSGERYWLNDEGKATYKRIFTRTYNMDGGMASQEVTEYELYGPQYNYGCCYEMLNGVALKGSDTSLQSAAGVSGASLDSKMMLPYPYYGYNSGQRITLFDRIEYDKSGGVSFRKTQSDTYVDGLLSSVKMVITDADNVRTTTLEDYVLDALGKVAEIVRQVFDAKGNLKSVDKRVYEYAQMGYGYYYPPIYYAAAPGGDVQTKAAGNSAIWAPWGMPSVKSVNVHLMNEKGETVDAFLSYETGKPMDDVINVVPYYGYGMPYNQVRITGTYESEAGIAEINGVFPSNGDEHLLPTEKLMALLISRANKPVEIKTDEQLLSELHGNAKVMIYENFDQAMTACAPITGAVCSSTKKVFYSYVMENGDRVYKIAVINESRVFGSNKSSRSVDGDVEADLERALHAAGFHAIAESGDVLGGAVSYDKVRVEKFEEISGSNTDGSREALYRVVYSAPDCGEDNPGGIKGCAIKTYNALVKKTRVLLPQADSYLKYTVSFSNETRLVVNYEGGQAYIDWDPKAEGRLTRTDIKTGEAVIFVDARDMLSCSYPKDGPALCASLALLPGYEQVGSYRKMLEDGGYEDRIIMGQREVLIEEIPSPVVVGTFHAPDDTMASTLMRSVYTLAGENQSWLIDRLPDLRKTLDPLDGLEHVSFIPGKSFSLEGQEIFTSGILITENGQAFVFEEGKIKPYHDAQFITLSESRCPANPAMGAPCSISQNAMRMSGYETLDRYTEVLLDGAFVIRREVILIAWPDGSSNFIPVEKMPPEEVKAILNAVGEGLELLGVEIEDMRPVDGNLVYHYVFRAVSSSLVHMERLTGRNLMVQDANGSIHEIAETEHAGFDISVNDQIRYIKEPDPRKIDVEAGVSGIEVAPGEKIIFSLVKERGGRILMVWPQSQPWHFASVTPEIGFQIKLALHHEVQMPDISGLKLTLTGETAAKCLPDVKCSHSRAFEMSYQVNGESFSAEGLQIITTLSGKEFIYYEISNVKPAVKEDPLLTSATALIRMSLSEALGIDEKTFDKAIQQGLIAVSIDPREDGTKTAPYHVRVKLDPSLAVHLKNGEVMLADVLGAGLLPENLSFILQDGLQMGRPCKIDAEGNADCPPPSLVMVSGEFHHKGHTYRLNYQNDPSVQDGVELKPMYGDSLLKSVMVTQEGPTSTTPVALIEQVSFERLDNGDIRAVILRGIDKVSVLIQRQMDGRLYVSEVMSSDGIKSQFNYVTAIADCAAPPPGMISNCPGPIVSLNEVIRSKEDSKISSIGKFGVSAANLSTAVIIRVDNEMKEISFGSTEELLALAREFEADSKEKQIAAAIEAARQRVKALISEMHLSDVLTEEEYRAALEKIKKYEEALVMELRALKKTIDEINKNGSGQENAGGLLMIDGGHYPDSARQLEQSAVAALDQYFQAANEATLIKVRADGTKIEIPIKAMTDILMAILPGGRWGSTPEDYEKLLGFKPEFNPGAGLHMLHIFPPFYSYQLAYGPSAEDLHKMMIRYVEESGVKGLIQSDGKVNLRIFRRALLGVDRRISAAIKAAEQRILGEVKLDVADALTEEQVKALLEQLDGLAGKMTGLLRELQAEINSIEDENKDPLSEQILMVRFGGPEEAANLEFKIEDKLRGIYAQIIGSDILVPATDGTLVRLPMKDLRDVLASVVGSDQMYSLEALSKVLGLEVKMGTGKNFFLNVFSFMTAMMAAIPDVRAAIIEYVRSSDRLEFITEGGRVSPELFRLALLGAKNQIQDAVSQAYVSAASDAGIFFIKNPEIKILSLKVQKRDGNQLVLNIRYSADSGEAFSAEIGIGVSDKNQIQVSVLSIQAPFANQDREAMVKRVRADLAEKTGLSADSFKLISAKEVTWNNGCLGVDPGPGSACTMALVPGYEIVLANAAGQQFVYHTDRRERFILVNPPVKANAAITLANLPADSKVVYKGGNGGFSFFGMVTGYGRVDSVKSEDGKKTTYKLVSNNSFSSGARGTFTLTPGKDFSLGDNAGLSFKGDMKNFTLSWVDISGNIIEQQVSLEKGQETFIGVDLSKNAQFDVNHIRSIVITHAVRERGLLDVTVGILPDTNKNLVQNPAVLPEISTADFDASKFTPIPVSAGKADVYGRAKEAGLLTAYATHIQGPEGDNVRYDLAGSTSQAGYIRDLSGIAAEAGKPFVAALKGGVEDQVLVVSLTFIKDGQEKKVEKRVTVKKGQALNLSFAVEGTLGKLEVSVARTDNEVRKNNFTVMLGLEQKPAIVGVVKKVAPQLLTASSFSASLTGNLVTEKVEPAGSRS